MPEIDDTMAIARAVRDDVGAHSPGGHVASNVLEIGETLRNYERPEWAKDDRQTLPYMWNRQVSKLAAI